MDDERFDGLAKELARPLTRRRLKQVLLVGLAAFGLSVVGGETVDARTKKPHCTRGKRRCGRKCCTRAQDCCKGRCLKKCPSGLVRSAATCTCATPPCPDGRRRCAGQCCPSNQSCGGGGTPNLCGCTPTTCAGRGKNCGTMDDGCGNTLSCGECPGPTTCGGGGTPNVCGYAATCPANADYCGRSTGAIDFACGSGCTCVKKLNGDSFCGTFSGACHPCQSDEQCVDEFAYQPGTACTTVANAADCACAAGSTRACIPPCPNPF